MPVRLATVEESVELLRSSRRVAVLGIKPESRAGAAAFWVPEYLARVGYEIVPVPVRYPEAEEILGRRVVRRLSEIAEPVDIVSVFRKPAEVPEHVAELLALHPRAVWFQSGLIEMGAAAALVAAGIVVVHDCIACRRATIAPSTEPFAR